MTEEHEVNALTFGGSAASVGGSVSGVLFAVAVPWVLLAYGQVLGPGTQRWLVIGSIALGGLISLTCAVLGVVMPRQIEPPEQAGRAMGGVQTPPTPVSSAGARF